MEKKCILLPSMTQFCLNHRIDPAGGSGWQSSPRVRRCIKRVVRRLRSFGSRVINERGMVRTRPRACELHCSPTIAGSLRRPVALLRRPAFCQGHVVISGCASLPRVSSHRAYNKVYCIYTNGHWEICFTSLVFNSYLDNIALNLKCGSFKNALDKIYDTLKVDWKKISKTSYFLFQFSNTTWTVPLSFLDLVSSKMIESFTYHDLCNYDLNINFHPLDNLYKYSLLLLFSSFLYFFLFFLFFFI